MTKDEAMELALENICGAILCEINPMSSRKEMLRLMDEAIAALHQALEQPEQEPVALETVYETIIQWDEGGGKRSRRELARRIAALYTAPPKREWVGLTDEERKQFSQWAHIDVVRRLEKMLKEKNCG